MVTAGSEAAVATSAFRSVSVGSISESMSYGQVTLNTADAPKMATRCFTTLFANDNALPKAQGATAHLGPPEKNIS